MVILEIWLIFLLFLCLLTSKKVLITPQLGFIGGFFASVTYGLFWVDEWSLELSNETFWVLFGGITLFFLTSLAVQILLDTLPKKRFSGTVIHSVNAITDVKINIPKWKLQLFLLIQIATLVSIIIFLMSLTSGSLSTAIFYFRNINLFSDDTVKLPFILSQLRRVSSTGAFFWAYILIHSIIYRYNSHRLLLILCVVVGAINDVILGGRGGIIRLVISIIVYAYFIYGHKTKFKSIIKPKYVMLVISIIVLIICLFQASATLLGRETSIYSFGEYLAIYLSAEIKNLDLFIRSGFKQNTTFYNCQTFIYVINFLSGKFGLPDWTHKLDLPYRNVNGHNLGNVYTTFYDFLYDGGYFAVVYLTIIMAVITQIFHYKSVNSNDNGKINVTLIIYSTMIFAMVLSFFSDSFYEYFFTPGFVVNVIIWYLLKFYIEKVNVKNTLCKPKV